MVSIPRMVFCPPPLVVEPDQLDWIRAFYRALSAEEAILYLVHEPDDSLFGARPGLGTLFTGGNSRLRSKALNMAGAVVGCRWKAVRTARKMGKFAFLIALDNETAADAKRFEIPWCFAEKKITIENALLKFREARKAQRNAVSLPIVPPPNFPRAHVIHFCAIASFDHLPFLLGLVENLREVHGSALSLHLLALDQATARFVRSTLPDVNVTIYSLHDLWNEKEYREITRRSLPHRAFSSKARLLKRALAKARAPVFYFDCDLYFYRSPSHLGRYLKQASLLLFPQWNRNLSHARLHGMFNAGMVGVAPGAERFLDWWAELCLLKCGQEAGYFDDQGFLDMAPVYFDDVEIYRRGDENVAFWNMESLGLSITNQKDARPRLKNGELVGSLHAAQPDDLHAFEVKFAWDQLVTFFSSFRSSAAMELLFQNIILQQKNYLPEVNRLYKAFHLIRHRLDLNIGPLTARRTTFFVEGSGRHFLEWGKPIYRALKETRQVWRSKRGKKKLFDDPSRQLWIELQQRELFSLSVPRRPILPGDNLS